MKKARIYLALVFAGVITAFSCEDKTVNASKDCGCDGAVKSTLVNKLGTVEVIDAGGKRIFRIFNKNEDLHLIICDTTVVASLLKTNQQQIIKFSGEVKGFCDEPTVHLLPPIC